MFRNFHGGFRLKSTSRVWKRDAKPVVKSQPLETIERHLNIGLQIILSLKPIKGSLLKLLQTLYW